MGGGEGSLGTFRARAYTMPQLWGGEGSLGMNCARTHFMPHREGEYVGEVPKNVTSNKKWYQKMLLSILPLAIATFFLARLLLYISLKRGKKENGNT